ncbi:LPS export ABC transporter permease LptG [Paenirhodobacter populi]|uniref:LPS export ABC transporter permease LptG n=1 Tax=Paenirhodobacter populi TaxID=2306993 RepID=A0A443JJJ9_9RHOB|nr:LPS export ABC transporter permease LptG [Sinirhodobacter populi]RWR09354.1 LPS export ABC transporter permease LptG [Sinirhodobacter populi]RWR13037.1 LPS export ABC transporter permease LptG [Sinirhodobacter populi]RWR20755.1 LPS export ABC transporter permease LptG [Sinirhodobacter populi]RWR29782.1 LPS export ABC transporter permease LptG [Sinirhodobacter populi]RWR34166.1 LPS export ABC transporter permease LptG [Sinirhodobacter populi]
MTLSLYITRRFLSAFAIVLLSFWGVLFLIDMVEKIRSFASAGITLGQAAMLSALSVPQSLYDILPLVMVLSAVVLFLGLARSSELVVIRAAGMSALRLVLTPVSVALLIGVLAVAIGNPIVSATAKRYDTVAGKFRAGGAESASISSDGIWMRQGMGDGSGQQAVIHGARANPNATRLYDVTFLIVAPGQGAVRRIEAEEANLTPGAWHLSNVKDWPLGSSTNPERDATRADSLTLSSSLTAERIRDSFGSPSAVPIWQLPGFIRGIEAAGFSARRHMVWFQMELALPIVLAAMVLIAAGFNMAHIRFGKSGMMVLITLGAGLSVFFLRNIAQVLGDNGEIPVGLAAWAPPAIALMLALALVLAREDG